MGLDVGCGCVGYVGGCVGKIPDLLGNIPGCGCCLSEVQVSLEAFSLFCDHLYVMRIAALDSSDVLLSYPVVLLA